MKDKDTINKAVEIIASEIAKCAREYWQSLMLDAEGLIVGQNANGTSMNS